MSSWGRFKRIVAVGTLLCAVLSPEARAQSAYVSGSAGISAGDGGAAPVVSVAGGFLTTGRIGLEIDFAVTPALEFERHASSSLEQDFEFPIGRITYEITGRLLTFHTNVVAHLTTSGRVRTAAIVGGGVGTLSQRIRVHSDSVVIPGIAGFPDFVIPGRDVRVTVSDTGLSLQTGGIIEAVVSRHVALGAEVRYIHVFISPRELDVGRVSTRLTWRF
jgi:hypothetical protein